MKPPLPLALVLVAGALLATTWAIITPPLQGPDESAHVAYVQYLAETGKAPSPRGGDGAVSAEIVGVFTAFNLRPLVGVLGAKPAWTEADRRFWEQQIVPALPADASSTGSGPNAAGRNGPVYYVYELPAYVAGGIGSTLDRLTAMRLWTIPLFLGVIAFTWLLAGELLGRERWLQTLAAASVALLPQLAYLGGVANPDVMLAFLGAAFLYSAVVLVKRGPSWPWTAAVAGSAALTALTHPRGLALVVPALLAIGVSLYRHRPAARRALRLGLGGLTVVVAGAALAYVFARRSGAAAVSFEGGGASGGGGAPFDLFQLGSYAWQFYLPKLPFMETKIGPDYGYREVFIETFYGVFGSLEVLYKPRIYDLLQIGSAIGLIALAGAAVVRRRELIARWDVVLVLVGTIVVLLGLLHYSAYREMLVQPLDPILVGRYLLPIVPLFGVAIAFVAGTLPRRVGWPLAAGIIGAGLALHLAGLGMTLERFHG